MRRSLFRVSQSVFFSSCPGSEMSVSWDCIPRYRTPRRGPDSGTRYPDGGRSREAHECAEPKPASQHSKVSFRRIVTWASEACARIPSLHAIDPSVPDAQRGPRWLKLLKSGYISLDTPRPSTSMPDARSVAKSADDGRIALPRTIPVGSEAEPQGQS
jgi:hypothetical protein